MDMEKLINALKQLLFLQGDYSFLRYRLEDSYAITTDEETVINYLALVRERNFVSDPLLVSVLEKELPPTDETIQVVNYLHQVKESLYTEAPLLTEVLEGIDDELFPTEAQAFERKILPLMNRLGNLAVDIKQLIEDNRLEDDQEDVAVKLPTKDTRQITVIITSFADAAEALLTMCRHYTIRSYRLSFTYWRIKRQLTESNLRSDRFNVNLLDDLLKEATGVTNRIKRKVFGLD